MNATSENGQLAKEILTQYMNEFLNRNKNLYVFSAHLHMDEETPHLHMTLYLIRLVANED